MNAESTDEFQTPNSSNSKNCNASLKRKSCPANVECKKAKLDLGTPLNTSFASCGRLHRLTERQRAQVKQRKLDFKAGNLENTDKKESAVHYESFRTKILTKSIKKSQEENQEHRLTENQRTQSKQRRLELKSINSENTDKKESAVDIETLSKEELIELIKKGEEEVAARKTHERKVAELKESIETWKRGLNQVLVDLQKKLPTHSSKLSILQQLHVPLNVVEYVDDPDD